MDPLALNQSIECTVDRYGTTMWFGMKSRLCHRIDGPALIRPDGSVGWYLHGTHYSSAKEFMNALQMDQEQRTLYILKWGSWIDE